MENKKFSDVINEINKLTDKLKDPNTSIEIAIEDFKQIKILIKNAEEQLKKIETEVELVLNNDETKKL